METFVPEPQACRGREISHLYPYPYPQLYMDILVSMDIGLSISIDASISKVQLNIFSLVRSFCKIVITKSLTKIFNENLIDFNWNISVSCASLVVYYNVTTNDGH